MKCMILAAGYATRLYPLTENFPKPLLPVKDKAILDWLLDDIGASGLVDEVIVVSNHKFAVHFSDWAARRSGIPVRVLDDGTSSNETRLGAVRDILFGLESLEEASDMLVMAGDNLLDFSLVSFLEYARAKGTSCIMRYREPSEKRLQKAGVVEVDENDRVLSMEEKPEVPKTPWACPAFYYFTRQDLSLIGTAISEGCATDAPGSFASWLCGKTEVHAMEMPGKRYDIGTLDSYKEVCRLWEE